MQVQGGPVAGVKGGHDGVEDVVLIEGGQGGEGGCGDVCEGEEDVVGVVGCVENVHLYGDLVDFIGRLSPGMTRTCWLIIAEDSAWDSFSMTTFTLTWISIVSAKVKNVVGSSGASIA